MKKGWELEVPKDVAQKSKDEQDNMFEKSGLANITIYDEAF